MLHLWATVQDNVSPHFVPVPSQVKRNIFHFVVGLGLIVGSFVDLLHILYKVIDYYNINSYKHTRMLTFTCTHSCKGMHILRSHLVPVVRPLSSAPCPSKKKRAVYVFIQEGSISSSLCLQDRGRRLSVQPDQGTKLCSCG